jgi:hypothetical protein
MPMACYDTFRNLNSLKAMGISAEVGQTMVLTYTMIWTYD